MRMRWMLAALVLLAAGCGKQALEDPKTAEEALRLGNEMMVQAYNTEEILESNPDYDKMTLVDTDRYQQAMAEYDRAIELDPKSAEAYYRRGFAELVHEETMKAIGDFDEAIKLNPQDARVYFMRSRAYEALGDEEKSKQDREEALKLDPSLDS